MLKNILAAIILMAVPVCLATPTTMQMQDYSVILSGNASLNNDQVSLGAIIGGSLTLGNNVSFGASAGTSSTAMVDVVGTVTENSHSINLNSVPYYFSQGSGGLSLTNPGTALASNPYTPSSIFNYFAAQSASDAAMANSYASYSQNGNILTIASTASHNGVINLSASSLGSFLSSSASTIQINNVSGGSLVINVQGTGSALTFNSKIAGLTSANYGSVVWNFTNTPQLTIGSNVSTFSGTVLASNSAITWGASGINGQIIGASLTDTSSANAIGSYPYFQGAIVTTPEPGLTGLAAAAMALVLFAVRRLRKRV